MLRRNWLLGLYGALLIWLARSEVLPAHLRNLRLRELSGAGPYYAAISWGYGLGARPISVIFDFESGGAGGSITADGEALEAEIPLAARPVGAYRLSAEATYRVLGGVRRVRAETTGEL